MPLSFICVMGNGPMMVVITAHIFAFVITINLFLFALSNFLPVGNVLDVYDCVSSK